MTNGHKSLISRLNSTDNSLITNTMLRLVKKGRALNETHLTIYYGVILAIWDHTVSPATQVNTPRLNPSQTDRYSIYLLQLEERLI